AETTIGEQSTDALGVLGASGFASARIFGNSGGATIALDMAAHHAQAVDAVVAHEPPLPGVLPDGGRYLRIYDDIDAVLHAEGWQAAFTLFQTKIGQLPPEGLTALFDPASVFPPGPLLELMTRLRGQWEHMTRYEIRPFVTYQPDFDAIAAGGAPIAMGYGAQTKDAAVVQMSAAAAERLGAECARFPGGHTAPAEIPVDFAAVLQDLLG